MLCCNKCRRVGGGLTLQASAQSPALSRGGLTQLQSPVLGRAPIVRILRDDRVATLEMDYNAKMPFGQFWNMSGSPDDDAGFVVTWWPQATAQSDPTAGSASSATFETVGEARELRAPQMF
jgi:hypothetical protein